MKQSLTWPFAVALLITPTLAHSQSNSANTPGHKMQDKGSVRGEPGASEYSPGHQMNGRGTKGDASGASGYAPGHTNDKK